MGHILSEDVAERKTRAEITYAKHVLVGGDEGENTETFRRDSASTFCWK